ncbi:MAG: hypothetical protein HZB24_04005 [Desulfobacterales bacterium]|nr:hypothetical protein [Desulfobacterales bacterium]
MKAFKGFLVVLLSGWIMIACGGGGSSESEQSTGELSSQEQAEIVAAALSADQGGVGKDIENIARPADMQAQAVASFELTVSADMTFYDAGNQPQAGYDPETTDAIEYQSVIQGQFSSNICYFQEYVIDNRSSFMATDLLSGTALIEGSHSNHSSYVRSAAFNDVEVHFNLESDLTVVGLIVDLDAFDAIPEAGTIEGTISGSYERSSSYNHITEEFYFHFTATYMGDNTAEIELSNGAFFSVHLGSGTVTELE